MLRVNDVIRHTGSDFAWRHGQAVNERTKTDEESGELPSNACSGLKRSRRLLNQFGRFGVRAASNEVVENRTIVLVAQGRELFDGGVPGSESCVDPDGHRPACRTIVRPAGYCAGGG